MSSRQNDSWRNQYHAVEEFELPKETHRMLPPPSSSPTMPDHQQHQQQQQQQPPIASSSTSSSSTSTATVQHRNSRSFPSSPLNPQGPQARPSTSSGGSHQNHGTTSSKTLPRSPSSASQPLASLTSTPPVSSPFGSTGRPGSRGSFTFSTSPASPSTPLGGSLNGRSGLGLSGTQTPTTELLAAHHTFGGSALPTVGSRGSMILYRRADSGLFSPPISGVFDGLSIAGGGGRSGTATPVQVPSHTGGTGMSGMSEDAPSHAGLLPPQLPFSNNRSSVYSTSGESSLYGVERGLVAYAYDPDEDDESDDEEGDWLHDPAVAYPGTSEAKAAAAAIAAASGSKGKGKPLPKPGIDPTTHRKITDPTDPLYIPKPYIAPRISWRGLINIGTLVAMVASLLCLFVVYPMVRFYADDGKNALITGNLRINSTGQAEYINGEEGSEEGGGGEGEGEGTPTSTRPPRTTVTSINEGGNIFDRRVVKWKRETDDWAVEFPAPSYNLNFFGGEVKNHEVVEEVPVQVVQVVHVCLPSPTTAAESSSEEERKRRLAKSGMRLNAGEAKVEVKVEFGVGEEVVEGLYYQGKWAFSKPSEMLLFSILDNDDDEEEEEDEEDEEWQLVKKHLSTSPRLSIRLMDSPSSSDTPVSIRNVLVRSQEGTWSETSGCGAEAAEGDADAVNVSVSVERVLEVVGRRS